MILNTFENNLSFKFFYYFKIIKASINNRKWIKTFKKTKKKLIQKNLMFNSTFLVFTYFFKSHCNSKKNSLNFFLLSYQNKVKNLNPLLLNIFKLGYSILFFSNSFFKQKPLYINWKFINKSNINLYYLSFFIGDPSHSALTNNLFLRFFNKIKTYFYYVIDSFFNRKILFYLKKFKLFSIAVPFNKYIYSIISYPLIPINLIFNYNIFILIDYFFFYLIIFFKKLNSKKTYFKASLNN